jgi:hypothetical protein
MSSSRRAAAGHTASVLQIGTFDGDILKAESAWKTS